MGFLVEDYQNQTKLFCTREPFPVDRGLALPNDTRRRNRLLPKASTYAK